MISLLSADDFGRLEFDVSGTVTDADYRDVLIPALERAIAEHDRVRLLVRIDRGFERYTLRAALDDAEYGMKHWDGFDRVAVVGDPGWAVTAIGAFAPFMPCPLRIFPLAQIDEARLWLRESLGAIHQQDLGDGVLRIQLLGKLDAEVYAAEERDLDAHLAGRDRFRLLLDLREFDGWQGLAALGRHLGLVRRRRRMVERTAVVGHASWARLGARAASELIAGEARYFDEAQAAEAEAWLRG